MAGVGQQRHRVDGDCGGQFDGEERGQYRGADGHPGQPGVGVSVIMAGAHGR